MRRGQIGKGRGGGAEGGGVQVNGHQQFAKPTYLNLGIKVD